MRVAVGAIGNTGSCDGASTTVSSSLLSSPSSLFHSSTLSSSTASSDDDKSFPMAAIRLRAFRADCRHGRGPVGLVLQPTTAPACSAQCCRVNVRLWRVLLVVVGLRRRRFVRPVMDLTAAPVACPADRRARRARTSALVGSRLRSFLRRRFSRQDRHFRFPLANRCRGSGTVVQ